MARAADRRTDRADRPLPSQRDTLDGQQDVIAGPLPLRDFLPRLEMFTRLIPVRVWWRGGWRVVWVVIRSLELVQVANFRGRIKRDVAQER